MRPWTTAAAVHGKVVSFNAIDVHVVLLVWLELVCEQIDLKPSVEARFGFELYKLRRSFYIKQTARLLVNNILILFNT